MGHYGIGALTAVTILAELGDCRRFSSSRQAVRYAGLDITVHQSDQRRAPGHLSRQGPPALRWALFEAAQVARRPAQPRPRLLRAGRRAARRQPRLPGGRAQAAQAQLPHAARARRGGAAARMNLSVRAQPSLTPMRRGQLPACSCRHAPRGRPRKTERPQRFPQRDHPINHHVADPEPTRVVDRNKAGRPRAHTPATTNRAHAPPATQQSNPDNPDPALDARSLHK